MFVESTMEAAASIALTKRRERMQDPAVLCCATVLLPQMLAHA